MSLTGLIITVAVLGSLFLLNALLGTCLNLMRFYKDYIEDPDAEEAKKPMTAEAQRLYS
jgi:hypothetical protein